ncbi:MAG TPA: alpha/beta fold hydrolase [Dermatophilaceae bacterium]|nr:alpha/beta fold hydrolase [Dermatophilaceae bacterium]
MAVVAGLVGVVATGVGVAVAVPRLLATGPSWVAVAGLVVLAGGLAFLATAVVGFWRATWRWWRLALAPLLVLGLVGGYAVATGVLAAVPAPTPLAATTPTFPVPLAEVGVPTEDGVRLSAWWAPPRNGRVVVVLHGSGENRSAALPQAAVVARAGYGVLLLDARGHGRSEGRGMGFGWYGDQDVAGALDFVAAQPGVRGDPVALLGLSMGGEEAVGAAVSDGRVRAVVAEGATHRTAVDKARWLPTGTAGTLQRGIDRLTYGLADLVSPASPPPPLQDAVARAQGTSFLLVAAGSRPDETNAAEVLRRAAPDRVRVWTVPGAGHTGGLRAQPEQWEQTVLAFLDTALDR